MVGIIVSCLITYQLPIKQTLSLYEENKQLQGQLSAAENAPKRIRQIENQLATYKEVLKSASNDSLQQEEYVLNQVTSTCRKYGAAVVSFSPSEASEHKGYKIKTRTVQFRGTYRQLLQVVYALEHHAVIGRLASVRFILEEDSWQRSSRLFSYLYIQNIQPANNDEKADLL